MKMTKDMRQALVSSILEHTYLDQVQTLIVNQAAFAIRVYEDVYPKKMRTEMDAIPAGWLREPSNISVQLGSSSRDVTKMEFNGNTLVRGVLVVSYSGRLSPAMVYLRMPSKDYDRVTKVYEVDHPLAVGWEGLCEERAQLTRTISEAKKLAEGTVNAFTTVQALVKAWPEVESFTRNWFAETPALLSVPVAKLNSTFDLPVAGTARAKKMETA